MLLKDKTAVIHGGGGAIGSSVARVFAREGAIVFLAGRTPEPLERVAQDIRAAGGTAELAVVDACDEEQVERHSRWVAAKTGRIDIGLNAVGIGHVQGAPLADLSLGDFLHPLDAYLRTNFLTARAAARHMATQRSGVLLTLSTPGSQMPGPGHLGYGTTCGAVESFSRILAGEVAGTGVRVACLRPHAIPEAVPTSYVGDAFRLQAQAAETTVDGWLEGLAHGHTLLGRLPTLVDVAEYAAFLASDRARATTGAIANLTCGALVD